VVYAIFLAGWPSGLLGAYSALSLILVELHLGHLILLIAIQLYYMDRE